MANIANLVLADGQGTPVNKTFSPISADPGLATWKDRTAGIALGMPTVTLGTRLSNGTEGSFKTTARVILPVMEVISGSDGGYTPAPKVAYQMLANLEIVCPNRSVLQNRKDIKAFIKNLLLDAVMTNAVENFEPVF